MSDVINMDVVLSLALAVTSCLHALSVHYCQRRIDAHQAWLRQIDNRVRALEGLKPIDWEKGEVER